MLGGRGATSAEALDALFFPRRIKKAAEIQIITTNAPTAIPAMAPVDKSDVA
jgi:hypothetical protein